MCIIINKALYASNMHSLLTRCAEAIPVLISGLTSQVVSSKQPKLGSMQELSRIRESTTGYTFTSCVGSFTSIA